MNSLGNLAASLWPVPHPSGRWCAQLAKRRAKLFRSAVIMPILTSNSSKIDKKSTRFMPARNIVVDSTKIPSVSSELATTSDFM
jgi:hypothetical protein